ncbi:MAG: hypothetical protein ABI622_02775 [Chloroflexota bacterium]
MPRRGVRRRSLIILLAVAGVAVVAGTGAVLLGTAAPWWILDQLRGTGIVTDAAAVGGATSALGFALVGVGAGLVGVVEALRARVPWARPLATILVGAILAALLGSLAAALASVAADPGNGAAYAGAAGVVGIGLVAFAVVLFDLLRGIGPTD